jgi:NADH-quinone oxidoreductase subunit N
VSSKAAGFVALLSLILIGFEGRADVVQPLMWVLAALTMTIGNVVALRQTNVVRMLAYSGISQAGFMLAPLAVVGDIQGDALRSIVTYLLIYAAMNLGAFTVVMAVARKTGSGEIKSFAGLFEYAPSLAVAMTVFLFALAGIPPLAGWLAKFVAFRAVIDGGTEWAYVLAVVMAVNSVISLAYYANVAREMWMNPPPDEDRAPIRVPLGDVADFVVAVSP